MSRICRVATKICLQAVKMGEYSPRCWFNSACSRAIVNRYEYPDSYQIEASGNCVAGETNDHPIVLVDAIVVSVFGGLW